MTLEAVVASVASKFKYREDPKSLLDQWFVMVERQGVLQGDCDDFTVTCLWELCGRRLSTFIWKVLVTHKYKVHRVKSLNGYHVVGEVEGLWFDNWTLRALPKDRFFAETRHQHQIQYISPLIATYLACGLVARHLSK